LEIKQLLAITDGVMLLYQFLINTLFPDHLHKGPDFFYLLEGSEGVYSKWILAGRASATEKGTFDEAFLS
jgi:hypothetical protein